MSDTNQKGETEEKVIHEDGKKKKVITRTVSKTKEKNTPGIIGFILGIISVFLPIPYIDIMLAVGGLIGSGVGLNKTNAKRGWAIAGLIVYLWGLAASLWYTFVFFPQMGGF